MRSFLNISALLIFISTSSGVIAQGVESAPSPSRGFYAGFSFGGAQSTFRSGPFYAPYPVKPGFITTFYTFPENPDHPGFRHKTAGLTGGVFAGFDMPFMHGFFAGIEADIAAMQLRRSSSSGKSSGGQSFVNCPVIVPFDDQGSAFACTATVVDRSFGESYRINIQQSGLATLRGRIGYNFGATSVFLTAGFAASQIKTSIISSSAIYFGSGAFASVEHAYSESGKKSQLTLGFAVGLGLERQLTDSLRIRLEYLHYDFGTKRVNYATGSSDLLPAFSVVIGGAPSPCLRGACHKVRVNGNLARLGIAVSF